MESAFLHTLTSFEYFIRNLAHYNAATEESLVTLDNHITILSYLIGEELDGVSKEIGELLGQLWTRLGANRSRLAHAHSRFQSLSRAGTQTKAMKALVWDVRVELDGLQETSDALRSYAVEPLILDGPLPRADVVRSLSDGCQSLNTRSAGCQLEVTTIAEDQGGSSGSTHAAVI